MPPKRKQEERLFDVMEQKGAYGTHISYEPVDLEAEAEPIPDVAQQLGELAVDESLPKGLENKRERFKEKFKDKSWTPRYQYEMTLALQTLPIAIDHIADRMSRRNQPTASRIYETAKGYWAEASRILIDINDAYDFEGDDLPSTGRIRRDYQVRLAVAEHLLAQESFDELEWPDRRGSKKSDRERRLIKIADSLKDKPEEELLKSWASAQQSFTNEAEFWHDQLMSVQDSQRVQEIQSEKRSRRL